MPLLTTGAGAYAAAAVATSTWDPSNKSANITLSGGDLTAESTAGANNAVRGTLSRSSGQFGFEVLVVNMSSSMQIGIMTSAANLTSYVGSDAFGWGYHMGGSILHVPSGPGGLSSYANGDIVGVMVDFSANTCKFYKNGGLETTVTIAAGSSFPATSLSIDKNTANFAGPLTYTYAGYTAWG